MESGAVVTVADLRSRSIQNWVQDVVLRMPFQSDLPLEVPLQTGTRLPMALFPYQLSKAVYQGTTAGGVKWWFKTSVEPEGVARQHGYDISVRYDCRHSRSHYRKRATTDSRKSKHVACVDCPAFVRFKGSLATDCASTAVVVTATFQRYHLDPLQVLRKEFPAFKYSKSAEILASNKFAFIFENSCLAEDAWGCVRGREHALFKGEPKAMQQSLHHFWVWKSTFEHQNHLKPTLPAHRCMFLSYAMSQEVADMAASGMSPLAIITHLTKNGKHGMITRHKIDHIRATIESDMNVYTIRPSSKESACQAAVNMLAQRRKDKKDIDFIFLYTEPSEEMQRLIASGKEDEVHFDMIRMQTGSGEDGGLGADDEPPEPSSWLASLKQFFQDKWSGLTSKVVIGPSRDSRKKNAWLPHDRIMKVGGRMVLLLALMWCTVGEQLLFSKYPEVCGHDTKASVCSTAAPWFYCVGYRENFHTYVIFRGWVANETLAMFMWIYTCAWPYLHDKKRLTAVRAHVSDGKNEQINALLQLCLSDGLTPHAKMLRCAWHIINRAMYRIFGCATRPWQIALEKAFWLWQSQETFESLANFHEWIKTDFFLSAVVIEDMSQNDRKLFPDFIASLWSNRAEWALAHNIELQAFDIRANTFTEANFSVLTDHVGVSASMSAPTFVRREDLVHVSRHNKCQFDAFRDATRTYSHKSDTEWTKRFELAEQIMMPRPLEMLKNQILLGASCARSSETKCSLCSKDISECLICSKYLTATQKSRHTSTTLRVHLLCYVDEEQKKAVRFANMQTEFFDLVRSAPNPKHWRVVTCHMVTNGWIILCSCGYSMRNMNCCLHCSLLLQKASDYSCFGCEEDTLHVRHTNLYAANQDVSLVFRSHDDWKGVFTSTVSAVQITTAFPEVALDDVQSTALVEDSHNPTHNHATRHQRDMSTAREEERATKSQIIGSLRSRIQDVINIIESLQLEDVKVKAANFESVIFDFKQTLPMLPIRASTTRARRPAAEARNRRNNPLKRQKAKEAAAPKQLRNSAAFQRGGSAAGTSKAQPITFTSSGTSDQNDSHPDSDSDSASSIGDYGFRYGPEHGDQYGFNDNDSNTDNDGDDY
jgi:hypothetical protein